VYVQLNKPVQVPERSNMQVPFDSIKQQVWDEIRQAMKLSNQTESFWDNVQAFAHAVDWKASSSSHCYSWLRQPHETSCNQASFGTCLNT
jgi:hypothetical protein